MPTPTPPPRMIARAGGDAVARLRDGGVKS
jgi:hypothetical protein